jgi:hypothetical protein
LAVYDRLLERAAGVRILDGTDPPEELAHTALRHLVEAVDGPITLERQQRGEG